MKNELFLVLTNVLHCILFKKECDNMRIFKTLNIEPKNKYDNVKNVRRHIGLTPNHAIAIDEIKTLNEMVNDRTIYPSAVINFAMETLIKTIQAQNEDQQIDFILDGIKKYEE